MMCIQNKVLSLAILAVLAFKVSGAEQSISGSAVDSAGQLIFKPQNVGAPKVRIGGGSRGPEQADVELSVLAPEEIGYTVSDQPVLYWYISRPVTQPIEITVSDKLTTLLKTTINGVSQAGIQTLNLADHQTHLIPNVKYKWSVAIVNNPKQRSTDTFAAAGIILVPETAVLKNQLLAVDTKQQVRIYAEAGIWYNALATIQTLLEKTPNDDVTMMRAALLQQVELSILP